MNMYVPELMYALDSLSEHADWKNVYNVSGDDVCYCPICLGKVKLWNGQDPNKTYKKQRCFHHIDGTCSQESQVHFAYKNWLLEKGSKFKVNDKLYEVESAIVEKTIHTSFGDYRPDITIQTSCGKTFLVEVAYSSKKTDQYIYKWDEIGNDVLEIDVNEQMYTVATNEIPSFKLIYSSETGECYIKKYTTQEYDEISSQLKRDWKRQDLIYYKIQWEKFDWFWRKLQKYYTNETSVEDVCKYFKEIDYHGKIFIYTRFKSNNKHQVFKEYFSEIINNEYFHYLKKIENELKEKYGLQLQCENHSKTIRRIKIIYKYKIPVILSMINIRLKQGIWNADSINVEDIFMQIKNEYMYIDKLCSNVSKILEFSSSISELLFYEESIFVKNQYYLIDREIDIDEIKNNEIYVRLLFNPVKYDEYIKAIDPHKILSKCILFQDLTREKVNDAYNKYLRKVTKSFSYELLYRYYDRDMKTLKKKECEYISYINNIKNTINNCKNNLWEFEIDNYHRWILRFLGYEYCWVPHLEMIDGNNIEKEIQNIILYKMRFMYNCLLYVLPMYNRKADRPYPVLRIMEER